MLWEFSVPEVILVEVLELDVFLLSTCTNNNMTFIWVLCPSELLEHVDVLEDSFLFFPPSLYEQHKSSSAKEISQQVVFLGKETGLVCKICLPT